MQRNIVITLPLFIIYHIKMLIPSFREFNIKFGIDNKATSNMRIEDIGKDINPIEIIMRDRKLNSVANPEFKIFVNLYLTDGTHSVLVIRREGGLRITLIVLV